MRLKAAAILAAFLLVAGCTPSAVDTAGEKIEKERAEKIAKAEARLKANGAKAAADRKAAIPNAAARAKLLAGLKAERDDFQKITFYTDPVIDGTYDSRIYLYIGEDQNKRSYSLRMVVRYHGESWVFWDRALFNVGGDVVEVKPRTVKRDSSTSVWEQADFVVATGAVGEDRLQFSEEGAAIFAKLMQASGPVTMRFAGEHTKDRTIPADELRRFKDVGRRYMALFGLK
ncbi:MAG: hypothetical protein ABFD84_06310 [Candidatus Polarisedimenticolia bacterium]